MNIQSILSDKIKQAMILAGADQSCDALIRQSGNHNLAIIKPMALWLRQKN